MKTFFVTAQSGPIIQRLLLGRFYNLARERQDVRLVVFVEPDHLEICQKLFAYERCIIESVPVNKTTIAKVVLRFFAKASIPTQTIKLRHKLVYLNGKSFLKFSLMRISWLLGHLRVWRALVRAAEYYLFYDDSFWAPYFEKYRPDAVLASALLSERDTLLIKHARRMGVPSVGIPRGWDNFSSKLFLRAIPDVLLAFNSIMPEEAVRYADVPRQRIRLVGFPQFDRYHDDSWHMTKEEVARHIGADPQKRWVSYFTSGGFLTGIVGKDHGDHMEMVRDAVLRGELPSDICVVASVYPGYSTVFRKELSDVPTLRFGKDFYLNPEEGKLFMNFIRHSDVVLNFGSTVSLESAILDRPNITLGFNGKSDMGVPWQNKLSTTLDHVIHYRQLQDTGGVWRVSNERELVHAVKTYLENPALHHEGRINLLKELVGPLDGGAGERIFEVLFSVARTALKTIFIGAKKHATLRLFVASSFYQEFRKRNDVRLVVFVSRQALEVYRRLFGSERCLIQPAPEFKERGPFKRIFKITAQSSIPTSTIKLVNLYRYVNGGSPISFFGKNVLWALGHLRIWRALLRFIEYHLFYDDGIWKTPFYLYRPDAVFIPSAITESETILLKHAKRRGIPTVAMVNGWDNLTAKGSLRIHPDIMLLQNPSMIDDVVRLNDFPRGRTKVVGFSWFDHYIDPSWFMSKDEVAKALGLKPDKRWIGYFTGGAFALKLTRTKDNGYHVRILNEAIERKELKNSIVIVSVHPGHELKFDPGPGTPCIKFGEEYYFSPKGMRLLMNFIRHCDVAVNYGSTVTVEAAVFDRPIILVGFNGPDDAALPWYRKISHTLNGIYHYGLLQNTGGVWRVSNDKELIHALKFYLDNPGLHRKGREALRNRIAGPVGGAGRAILEELISAAKIT